MEPFEHLLNQIDAFIRKYYKNEMLKGGILFLGVLLLSYLVVASLEFFGRFSSSVRAFLFFSFLATNLFLLVKYLFIPLLKLVSFGKRIDRYQASSIIGSFFPNVSDRLLNTLQLNDSLSNQDVNFELIRASVVQKSQSLSIVPFVNGIELKKNLKYAKFVVPIMIVFVVISLAFPKLIMQGTNRIVHYNQEFAIEAPFDFVLTTPLAGIEEGQDVAVAVKLTGVELPEKIYLVSSQGKFLMSKSSKIASFYILKNLKENTVFHFEANGFVSDEYLLAVVPKSAIGRFQASIHYPAYLGKKDEIVSNAGDLEIPEGTVVEWSVLTKNTSNVAFKWNDTTQFFSEPGFKVRKRFRSSTDLKVSLTNVSTARKDSLNYSISVVKDGFPSIQTKESIDSVSSAIRFFEGQISDDYGLSSLTFYYQIVSEKGIKKQQKVSVAKTYGTDMPFTFAIDFRREELVVKDKIEYYFIVSDNDGVNGSKSVRSQTFVYELPSLSELNELRDETQNQTKKELSNLLNRTKEFQKDIQRLKKETLNSKSNEWNKLNQVNQLKEEQQSLQKELEQMQMQMQESIDEKNQLSEIDPELLEKQEMLQKLLEEVMDDELLDLLKQLEDLMKSPDKNQLNQKMDQLEMKSEDMKKQLDRSLEMLKKLQVNEKLDDVQKELNELSKEQKELKEAIENKKIDDSKSLEKQEEINKKFDEIKEDLKELKELNEALDKPMNLGDQEKEKEEITNELKDAKENLSKQKEKKAGDNQQKSADEMKKMADELEMMQSAANKKQDEEDINLLRSILESLMTLSFTQEETMLKFSKVRDNDPFYRKLGRMQRNIIDDTKIVADSLEALAKRQPKIATFIDKELNDIKQNFALGLEDIDEHRRRDLGQHLQFVMTAYNNLALMLNESLQSMQNQMQSDMPGSGSCDKPGGKGSKPKSGDDAGDMKEMLKKQLEQMKKGNNPGGKSPGDKEGEGSQGMPGLGNKEIAKMAAQQTAIRQRLEQMRNEMNKEGKGLGNKLNPLINELEQQEKDLINKRFSKEMIKRQQDILTRLLESEKALNERGFEEKRESKSGKNFNYSNQKRIDEYNQQKLKQVELLRAVDPMYRKYYRDRASEYFNGVF
jgi:hypothetical protein